MTQTHRQALPKGYMLHEYQLDRVLGAGGFGLTYLGWDTSLDKPVAIKEYLPNDLAVRETDHSVMPKSHQDEDNFQWGLERFLDEARTLAKFKHPNIIAVHRYFDANNTAYIVMEFAEGETLDEVLKRGVLEEPRLLSVLMPLLDGLEEVHRGDFLHRDIKPGNIVIRPDGSPVLLDFGSARQAIGSRSRSITSVVTPGYAPIEQYSARGNQGPWTDIYALGAVAYKAVSGETPPDVTERVRHDPMRPASEVCRGKYSGPLLNSIDWALSVEEETRPQDVTSWRKLMTGEAPNDLPSEESVPVREGNREPKPESKPERKHRTGLIGFGVLLLIVALVWWLVSEPESPAPRVTQPAVQSPEPPEEVVDTLDEATESEEILFERTSDGERSFITVDAGGFDQLEISFTDECWIEVGDSEQGLIYHDLNDDGDVLTIYGTGPFEILLGRATGVEMIYNGRSFDVEPYINQDKTAKLTVSD